MNIKKFHPKGVSYLTFKKKKKNYGIALKSKGTLRVVFIRMICILPYNIATKENINE